MPIDMVLKDKTIYVAQYKDGTTRIIAVDDEDAFPEELPRDVRQGADRIIEIESIGRVTVVKHLPCGDPTSLLAPLDS